METMKEKRKRIKARLGKPGISDVERAGLERELRYLPADPEPIEEPVPPAIPDPPSPSDPWSVE